MLDSHAEFAMLDDETTFKRGIEHCALSLGH
jgi:hypothetical protein